jgi:hypothetical protein
MECSERPCAFLTTRVLIETIAVFDEFERSLLSHVAAEDLGSMDALAQNRLFATKDEELLDGYPEALAISVLTFTDNLEKRYVRSAATMMLCPNGAIRIRPVKSSIVHIR